MTVKMRVAALVAMMAILGGCATFDDGTGAEIKKCGTGVVKSAIELDQINALIQSCLGEAYSPQAKAARTYIAILIIGNYGTRSIQAFMDEDREHAAADALLLMHRIDKAVNALAENNPPQSAISGTEKNIRTYFPNYRTLAARQFGDVQLYGVVRAALAPVFRRTKSGLKSYISAATGGAAGILSNIFRRKKIIYKKARFVRETGRLASAAIFDTRCLLEFIDKKYSKVHDSPANAFDSEAKGDPKRSCPTAWPADIEDELQKAIIDWRDETVQTLDEIANSS